MIRTTSRSEYVNTALVLVALLSISLFTPLARSDASLDLNDYAGKVVVVDFWASWCVPCRRSFPWLDEMQTQYADNGLVVIGINVDSDSSAARAFLDEFPVRFRIVEDPDGELAKKFDVIAMPSSYVIGRDGEIASQHLGFKVKETDRYESAIRQSLGIDQE